MRGSARIASKQSLCIIIRGSREGIRVDNALRHEKRYSDTDEKEETRHIGDRTGSPQWNNAKANTIDAKPRKGYGQQKKQALAMQETAANTAAKQNNRYI
jgi:hypothetical protein